MSTHARWRTAREWLAHERAGLGLLAVGLAGLALGCLLAMVAVRRLPWPARAPNPDGVVGLVTIHGYPEEFETPLFVGLVALVFLTPLACWAAWLAAAASAHWRRGLEPAAALRASAWAFVPAFPTLVMGLLDWSHLARLTALTLLAIAAGLLAVSRWPLSWNAPGAWPAAWVRALFSAERRLPSSLALLAGCVWGWFAALGLPPPVAARWAAWWWLWPLVFLGVWARCGGRPAAAPGAAQRAAWALSPALVLAVAPFLLAWPTARRLLLAVTALALATGLAWAWRARERPWDTARREPHLRLLRRASVLALALAWCWEPDLPGILVLPGDGDHLIAFLNEGLLGKLAYRDFWYPYGPLFYLLDLFSARVSGIDRYYFPAWLVTTAAGTLLLVPATRWTYLTWPARVLGGLYVFFAWPFRPVEFRVHLACFALIVALAGAAAGRRALLRAGGMLSALALLFSHEGGLAVLVALQPGLAWAALGGSVREGLRRYGRSLADFAGGWALVLVPALVWGAWLGVVDDYLRTIATFVRVNDTCCGLPVPSLWDQLVPEGLTPLAVRQLVRFLVTSPLFLAFYLPVLLYVATALYVLLRRLRGRRVPPQDTVLVGLAALGVVLFRVALGRSEEAHARFATVPALWLLGALLERVVLRARGLWAARRPGGLGAERLAELALLASGALFVALSLRFPVTGAQTRAVFAKLAGYHALRPEPRVMPGWQAVARPDGRRFFFTAATASTVQATLDHLRAHTAADEGVFAFPYAFRYNALLARPQPLPYAWCLWNAAASAADQARLVRDLEKGAPRYVIYDESEWPDMDGVPTGDRFALVADYIFEHYSLERQIGPLSVLRRRPSPEPEPAVEVVEVARPERRGSLLRGWYHPERAGGEPVRWSSTHATVRLARTPAARELFIDAHVMIAPGAARHLTAHLDGRELGRVDLAQHPGWATLVFPLPAASEDTPVQVQAGFDVSRPFPAKPDLRRLGIFVKRIGLR